MPRMVPHRCDRGIWWGSSGSGFVGWEGRVCEVWTISLSVVVGVYCGFGHRNYQRVSRPARSSIRNCLIETRDPSKTQAPSFRTRPGWSCCRLADQFSTLGHLCSSVGSVTVTTNASRVPSGHRSGTALSKGGTLPQLRPHRSGRGLDGCAAGLPTNSQPSATSVPLWVRSP